MSAKGGKGHEGFFKKFSTFSNFCVHSSRLALSDPISIYTIFWQLIEDLPPEGE
jgi:hypothetical protein